MHARNLLLKVNLMMHKTLLLGSRNSLLDFRDHIMVEHGDVDSLSAG